MSLPFHISPLFSVCLFSLLGTLLINCARLPETTRVLHDDDRVMVTMETDFHAPSGSRTTPTDISAEQLTKLLRGFSVRPISHLPIPILADEGPPRKLLRERELEALTPVLHEALLKVGFHERIRFEVVSPGRNPRYWRDVTGGWIKIRDRYFHLHVDYYHVEQPVRKTDAYDPYYPSPPTPEQDYAVYFEPQRLYVTDPLLDQSAVDLERFSEGASP